MSEPDSVVSDGIPPRQAPTPDDWPGRHQPGDEPDDETIEDLKGPTEFGESVG